MDAFDPAAPLPGLPEPWASMDTPSHRDGPPYHMTEMIRAEPALARRLLDALAAPESVAATLAAAVRTAVSGGSPILVVGCGTSEHGALAAADILRDACTAAGLPSAPGAGSTPVAVQAFEASLEAGQAPAGALVIGITHEGGTWATNRALAAARAAGATTAVVTVSASSPAAELADIVVTTNELDQSWCHTIGYLSPILAAAAVGARLAGMPRDATAAVDLLAHGLEPAAAAAADSMARALANVERVIVVASGADRTAARELTLKIEEGAHLPAAMRDLETMLHGHLAGVDARTGLILVLADRTSRGARTARALGVLRACRQLGMPVGAILVDVVAEAIEPTLTPAGRIEVPDAASLPAPVAALLATATPLQLLAEHLAIARGVNPDPIRRDDPVYLAAADAAG
jgi:glucosamine--fructose-6-phosphate aminotransferase (isomerizing)